MYGAELARRQANARDHLSEHGRTTGPADIRTRRIAERSEREEGGFSVVEDLIGDQGGAAFRVEYTPDTGQAFFSAYQYLDTLDDSSIQRSYLLGCDDPTVTAALYTQSPSPLDFVSVPTASNDNADSSAYDSDRGDRPHPEAVEPVEVFLKSKKTYNPVAKKVRPVATELPERFRLRRTVVGDPLANMPKLDPNPKPFVPTGRYTAERRSQVRADHEDFLWPAELDLIDDLMCKFNDASAWNDLEKGHFWWNMFEPVKIPVIEHKP